MLHILLLLLLYFASYVQYSHECESPWEKVGKKCMWKSTQLATRSENLRNCIDYNATLVSPRTYKENDEVRKFIGNNPNDFYWLSGHLYIPNLTNPKYMWMDGQELNYSQWIPGQPSNWNTGGGWCVALNGINGWDDQPCTNRYKQLCEKELEETQSSDIDDGAKENDCDCSKLKQRLQAMRRRNKKQAEEIESLKKQIGWSEEIW